MRRHFLNTLLFASAFTLAGDLERYNLAQNVIDSFGAVTPLLFRVYNYGILAVLSALAGFSIFYAGAVAAAEGAGVARKINTWVLVRSLLGATLLIPNGSNDYAFIQKLIMKVVLFSMTAVSTMLSGLTPVLGINELASGVYPSKHVDLLQSNPDLVERYQQIAGIAYEAAIEKSLNPGGLSLKSELNTNTRDTKIYYQTCYEDECRQIGNILISSEYAAQAPMVTAILSQAVNAASTSVAPLVTNLNRQLSKVPYLDGSLSDLEKFIEGTLGSDNPADTQKITENNNSYYKFALRNAIPSYSKSATGFQEVTTCQKGQKLCWDNNAFNLGYSLYIASIPRFLPECLGDGCNSSTASTLTFETMLIRLPEFMNKLLMGTDLLDSLSGVVNSLKEAISSQNGLTVSYTPKRYNLKTLKDLEEDCVNATDDTKKAACLRKAYRDTLRYNALVSISESTNKLTIGAQYAPAKMTKGFVSQGGIQNTVKKLIKDLRSHVNGRSMPQDSPYYHHSKSRLNVVPIQMDIMFANVLSAITGCSEQDCNGAGLFSYNTKEGADIVNPITYLTGIGQGMFTAGKLFINNNTVVVVDDELTRMVYGGTTPILAAGRGVSAGLQAGWPLTTDWTRGAIFASNAIATNASEVQGFLADLDQFILYKFESLGSALATLFMIWGAFFSIFLPLVPYMVVLFSVIGWVLLIIEAMLASPLIALGLAHPNSQQFLGASDQVLMMLLLVSLRPLLIAIAIFFACVIAYLAVFFLNEGIIQVFNSLNLFNETGAVQVALIISGIMVYTYLVFLAVIQAFSLVGTLPDTVSRWIGMGPMGGTSPLQQIFSVRESFEGGAQQALSGAQQVRQVAKSLKGSHKSYAVSLELLSKKYTGNVSEADILVGDRKAVLRGLTKGDRAMAKAVLDDNTLTAKDKADIIRKMRSDKARGVRHRRNTQQLIDLLSDGNFDAKYKGIGRRARSVTEGTVSNFAGSHQYAQIHYDRAARSPYSWSNWNNNALQGLGTVFGMVDGLRKGDFTTVAKCFNRFGVGAVVGSIGLLVIGGTGALTGQAIRKAGESAAARRNN